MVGISGACPSPGDCWLTPTSMMVLAVGRAVVPRQIPGPAPVTLGLLCLQLLGRARDVGPDSTAPRMLGGPAAGAVG